MINSLDISVQLFRAKSGLQFICLLIALSFSSLSARAQEQVEPASDDAIGGIDDQEAWNPLTSFQNRKRFNNFYGQLNRAILAYDDGDETDLYPLIDNGNSSSRLGFSLDRKLDGGADVDFNIEYSFGQNFTTTNANVDNNKRKTADTDEEYGLRKLEMAVRKDGFGRFWFGQGSMATDGVSEVDFSGTGVAQGSNVQASASGQFLRQSNGDLSGIQIGEVFDDFNGLGRKFRLRYDSPDLGGYGLRAAIGQDWFNGHTTTVWDVSALMERGLEDSDPIEFKSAFGFSRPSNGKVRLNYSASVLQKATGLNLTFATALNFRTESERMSSYIYGKVGVRKDLFRYGQSSLAADAYFGRNINTNGSRSRTFSIAAVQEIESINSEVYLSMRRYTYIGPSGSVGYQPSNAILFGMRIRF